MKNTWIFGFITLLGLFELGSTIMCYECNSATNSMCSEKLLSDKLKRNCSEHDRGGVRHTLCRKIVQHVDTLVNGQMVQSRIIRSCGWDETKYKGQCYHRSGFGSRHEVCTCDSNLCNGSHQVKPLFGLFAFLCATAVVAQNIYLNK